MMNFQLAQELAQLSAIRESRDASISRATLFIAAALQIAEFFELNPSLESFRFTTLLQVNDTVTGQDRVINQQHHIKIVTQWVDAPVPDFLDAEMKAQFFYAAMPYWLMGTGTVELSRKDRTIQEILQASAESDERRVKGYALALQLDQMFQRISHACMLGEVQ